MELARIPEVARVVEIGDVRRRVEPLDPAAGDRRERDVPLLALRDRTGSTAVFISPLIITGEAHPRRPGGVMHDLATDDGVAHLWP